MRKSILARLNDIHMLNNKRALFLCLLVIQAVATAQIPTARQDVLNAEAARLSDPWPRGMGHVVLAPPGSLASMKGYLEPGGSFSPEFGSFGVSLWITDQRGIVRETSDSIPLGAITQRFEWPANAVTPTIHTETPGYIADWSLDDQALGQTQLVLKPKAEEERQVMLAVRSVGPSGDAIESLSWSAGALVVNGRYRLTVFPAPTQVYVGLEGPPGWMSASTASRQKAECHDQHGWCYARIEISQKADTTLRIMDTFPSVGAPLTASDTRPALSVELPDRQFAESLNAQVAHLMMGLVENQTRGGEPNHYRIVWLHDGAYEVAALAEAGRLDTARDLIRYFAEHDFFSGFGAEADNPGLALWATEEVASRLHDAAFDQYLWHHVYRKAEFILGMQNTHEKIERVYAGTIIPSLRSDPDVYTLALPAKNGLIIGRMDNDYRGLYITAVSYCGLLNAIEMAKRLGYREDAERWQRAALELKKAWNLNFNPVDRSADNADPRTYISGLWLSGIVDNPKEYAKGLDAQLRDEVWDDSSHRYSQTPLWTYFNFAFAHEELALAHPDKAFEMLSWFWRNQTSPGLYSWWESNTEENTTEDWKYARGWVRPPYVTPHYWAAAECLLLQLSMLAYIDQASTSQTLVIGGGIPKEWISKPMHVHGFLTPQGLVDWDWDGTAMAVKLHGSHIPVRLGPGFPPGAKVTVSS